MKKGISKDDDFFDLVKSDNQDDVEMEEFFLQVDANMVRSKSNNKVAQKAKSGYLFPTTLAMENSNPVHQALFNVRYFEDPNSSLNKSFIESSDSEDATQVSNMTLVFKVT